MPTIHLIAPDGTEHRLDVPADTPLMQAATAAGVPGIVGECGGSAMCATCHVVVADTWQDRLSPPLANELEMLECTASERQPGSRLACQIRIDSGLDGLVVHLPERQQ